MNVAADPSLKEAVEAFLYHEADLLDEWRLPEWERLLTDDATYRIPPLAADGAEALSPDTTMFIAADDRNAIAARVERLMGKNAWAEHPRSRLRHMISNVRILEEDDGEISVASNFTLYRVRRQETSSFIGKYVHRLRRENGSFRIRDKLVVLDMDVLRGQGGVSIIL